MPVPVEATVMSRGVLSRLLFGVSAIQRPFNASHFDKCSFCSLPGRAKVEFKLAAVNQSSKAGQWGKF
jgi:hypothetical protein